MKEFAKFVACTMAIAVACIFASCDGNKIVGFDFEKFSTSAATDDSAITDSVQNDRVENDSTAMGYKMRPGKKIEGKLIALTFDDGPNCKVTPRILNTLKKYGAHATFFVVGECIDSATSEVMRRAVDEGNEIACHTWTHPHLTRISTEQRQDEITKTCNAIQKAVGFYPNFFRPPYLDCDSLVLNDVSLPGISGFSSDDYKKSSTPRFIIDNVLEHAAPNAIIILHDLRSNDRTPEAIETLVPKLQRMGYTLVTVTDLFTSLGIDAKAHLLYSKPTSSNRGANKHSKSAKTKDDGKGDEKKKSSKDSKSKDSKSKDSKSKDSKSKDSKSKDSKSKDSKSKDSKSKDSKSMDSKSKDSKSMDSKSMDSSEPASAPAKEAIPAKEAAPAKETTPANEPTKSVSSGQTAN